MTTSSAISADLAANSAISRTSDALERKLKKAYEESRGLKPGYLEGLIKESGASRSELAQIFLNHSDGSSSYALMAFCLLKRTKQKGEVSQRYFAPIDAVSRLIRTGKIKFTAQPPSRQPDATVPVPQIYFGYNPRLNTVLLDPQMTAKLPTLNLESILIHELFHAYQDYQEFAGGVSMMEAEAYLLKSDFLYRKDPGLLPSSHFIQYEKDANGHRLQMFSVPAKLVKQALDKPDNDKQLKEVLGKTREAYLIYGQAIGSIPRDEAFIRNFYVWLRMQNPAVREELIISAIEASLKKAQSKSIDLEIECPADKPPYRPFCNNSKELVEFMTFIEIMLDYLYSYQKFDRAQELYNKYAVDAWFGHVNSLMGHPVIDRASDESERGIK